MKKLITLTLLSAFLATPVFAADESDIQSDKGAIKKDNAALQKDQDALARNRAAKAMDKANGNTMSQVGHSLAIGADQTEIGEKNAEKNVDKKILTHDKNNTNTSTDN